MRTNTSNNFKIWSISLWKILYELLVCHRRKQNLMNAAVHFQSWVLLTSLSLCSLAECYFHNCSESAFLKILIYPVIRSKRFEITADLWFTSRMKDQILLGSCLISIVSLLNASLSFQPLSSFHLKQLHFIHPYFKTIFTPSLCCTNKIITPNF